MRKNLRWKGLLILAVAALCIWSTYPPGEKIKLGLDLEGGIHLIMKVNMDDALNALTDETVEALGLLLDNEGVSFTEMNKQEIGLIQITGVAPDQESELRRLVEDNYPGWDARRESTGQWRLQMRDVERNRTREETLTQAIETIRRRVDALGVAEPIIAPHGDTGDQILVQLPGFDDVDRAKNIIRSTAKLELRIVEGTAATREQLLGGRSSPPPQTEIFPGVTQTGASDRIFYLLQQIPVITGRDLKNARPSIDYNTNMPSVNFTLKPEASSKFRRATQANVGRQLAIVLDGQVMSAPVIEEAIPTGSGRITGIGSNEEALDLALVLRSGALPASLEYQEERTVGPSLGADSIRSGVMASIVGLAGVVLFILVYYRLSGANAIIALILNLVILLGAMAYFRATLTLPGIAGVVLTIGIGVDANVLIFERIKEEIRGGKTPRTAISAGFGKVFWTIFDANLTSLIAAAILFQFGTGPVQGFAVTLSIGLLANMFTAIFVSRFIFDAVLGGRHQVEALSI
jgi:preprotein translocase subunit SecD